MLYPMRHFPPSAIAPLVAEWDRIARPAGGTVSIQLRDLRAQVAGRLDDTTHYAASTIKLAIGVTAFADIAAGRVDPLRPVPVRDEFSTTTGERFRLARCDDQDEATWDRLGATQTFGTLVERMIVDSSNIAANLVAEQVTLAAVARTLGAVPAPGVAVRHLLGDAAARHSGLHNDATADGLCRVLAALARGRLLPAEQTGQLLGLLAGQTTRRMIPAGLPDATWSAGKPGWLDDVAHDVQLVRPGVAPEYILAVCTTTELGARADDLIARISHVTWEHWIAWHTA
jgi:beta-lactamase class A